MVILGAFIIGELFYIIIPGGDENEVMIAPTQEVEEQWVEERYWGLAFFLTGEKGIFHFQVLC